MATATMAALARAITMDARSKNWCWAATVSHRGVKLIGPCGLACELRRRWWRLGVSSGDGRVLSRVCVDGKPLL